MLLKFIESIKYKILIPFHFVPANGLSPEKLAFSITLGIIAGIFPVIGTTTLLSLLLTMVFRQNLLIVQAVQWILAFAQVLVIIPFMKFGAYILNQNIIYISIEQINFAFKSGLLTGLTTIGIFHLYAILTWLIVIVPAGIASYFVLLTIFQRQRKGNINQ